MQLWASITPQVFLTWEWVSRVWKEHRGHLATQQAITRERNSAGLKTYKECMQLPFWKSVLKNAKFINIYWMPCKVLSTLGHEGNLCQKAPTEFWVLLWGQHLFISANPDQRPLWGEWWSSLAGLDTSLPLNPRIMAKIQSIKLIPG